MKLDTNLIRLALNLLFCFFTFNFAFTCSSVSLAEPNLLRPFKSTYYVDKIGGIAIVSPTNPSLILGQRANGSPITNSFLLNSKGLPLEVNDKQLPYYGPDGRPYLGIKINGQIGAVNADHLSKVGIRPLTIGQPNPPDPGPNTTFVSPDYRWDQVDPETVRQAMTLVYEFHNTSCDSLRHKVAPNMAAQISALNAEWSDFIKKKLAESKNSKRRINLDTQLAVARNLDLVSRTILYEADILGLREGVVQSRTPMDNKTAYEKCTSIDACPISACERDIMTLTIRNRGLAKRECASPETRKKLEKLNPNACKYFGDFAYRATNPKQYNIWDPRWTSKYITSCFLKNGLEDGGLSNLPEDEKWTLMRSIRQFKLTLETSARLLYGAENSLHNYFRYDRDIDPTDSAVIKNMKHYIHPLGMPLCKFGRFDQRISVQAAYVENVSDEKNQTYTMLIDDVLLAEGAQLSHPFRKNDPHKFRRVYLRDEEIWLVAATEVKDLPPSNSTNVCLPMGLASLKDKDLGACDLNKLKNLPNYQDTWPEQSRFVPIWATNSRVRQPIVGCNIPIRQPVEIGYKCDPRFQHFASVDPSTLGLPIGKLDALLVAGYNIRSEKNSNDEFVILTTKNEKTISSLTLVEDNFLGQIFSLKKAVSAENILIADFENTVTGSVEQKTCAYVALISVASDGQLNLIEKKEYRCDVLSESARETAKSFHFSYKIDTQKPSPKILIEN